MSDTHAETVAYVRDTMVPQKAPPPSTVGLIGWGRENLFSGWVNTLMTIVSSAVILLALYKLVPWFISPTWEAASLTECREILAALGRGGEHGGGACWGVIRDRWQQLMFGFYPSDLYWRPVLAFAIFLLAITPVLFHRAPRALLYLLPVFPFIDVWLLWGGSIWHPVSALMGFVIGYGVFILVSRWTSSLIGVIAAVIVPVIWWLYLGPAIATDLARIVPMRIESVQSREFGGFMLSITIGVTAILAAFPLGIILALGRRSDLFIVKSLCVGFIEFIRGVPLITLLFVASVLLNIFLPPGTNFDIILRVMIMVTLFSAAYLAEVIRGGLAALPKGQYEGADSLGLDYWQAQRLVIMPQALKISIPGIVSTFIGLFKDTTLVSIISMFDPVGLASAIRADTAWNGIYWELFIFIGAVFFVFCFSMSRYSMYLERKLKTSH
ncbi:amino acid ABC transporter permease [Sulfitobacter aestuarii]|uniref:Amino acid ABC transporter permease n=1 Tax=Sulfitobacter aestuarii TaxID=2161676 RepID=A0ABW5TZV2_9RHOB